MNLFIFSAKPRLYACEQVGTVQFAFDFSPTGQFSGTRLIKWVAMIGYQKGVWGQRPQAGVSPLHPKLDRQFNCAKLLSVKSEER